MTLQAQHNARGGQPPVPNRQPATATQPDTEEPPSPTSSTSSSQHQKEKDEGVGPLQVPEVAPSAKTTNPQKATSAASTSQKANSAASTSQKVNSAASNLQKANSIPEITSQARPTEAEGMQIDPVSSPANESSNPSAKETVVEEPRVTRRLRRNRSAPNN